MTIKSITSVTDEVICNSCNKNEYLQGVNYQLPEGWVDFCNVHFCPECSGNLYYTMKSWYFAKNSKKQKEFTGTKGEHEYIKQQLERLQNYNKKECQNEVFANNSRLFEILEYILKSMES